METLAAPDVSWTSLEMSHFCPPFSQILCAARCRVQLCMMFHAKVDLEGCVFGFCMVMSLCLGALYL